MAERPPDLPEQWLSVWKSALRAMKGDGTWSPATRPLLDLYVAALMQAEDARGKGWGNAWDRAARRASMFADQLALTPRGRKVAGVQRAADPAEVDPFAGFDSIDALGQRRAARSRKAQTKGTA